MLKQVLILCLCTLIISVDYCEVSQDSAQVFVMENETRLLNLNSFIKGFDLTFDSDTPQAKVYSAYEVSVSRDLSLKDYASLKSVDMREYDSIVGSELVLLAQKDNNQQIAIWAGDFEGFEYLPDLSKIKAFKLPSGQSANCFDARSASTKGDVILNCQTILKSTDEEPFDILCHISPEDTTLDYGVNCNQISSLGTSLSRKSRVLNIKDRTYLLSQNSDLDSNGNAKTVDYIMVYYLNGKGKFVFANIIDGSQLTNPALDISDFVVTKDNLIIVADRASSRLIYYEYFIYNDVKVSRQVSLTSQPLALAYQASRNSIFVATRQSINEHEVQDPAMLLSTYETDPKDNQITRLQVSSKLVAFTTKNNNLFLYERNQHKINYLLERVVFSQSSAFVLSKHVGFLYTFNLTNAQAISVSEPYLSLSGISDDQNIIITASSTKKKCQVRLDVKYVQDSTGIIDKKSIEDGNFKVDPTSGLTLNLKDYYGGSNLIFGASQKETASDFSVSVNQLESFDIKASFGTAEKTSILQIDRNSFYLIGINSIKESMVYVDYCSKKNSLINCQTFWSSKVPLIQTAGIPVAIIEGKIRSNGDPFIAWTYAYTHVFAFVNLRIRGIGFRIRGDVLGLPISSIQLADTYTILLSKTSRYISIQWENQPYSSYLDESKFTAEELVSLEQFYPREIIMDPMSYNSFFVKLPTRIARFVILDSKEVKFAGIVRDFEEYILDSEWTFTYTGKNIVTIRGKELKEEYYNPSTESYQTLQKIPFENPNFSELSYNSQTNLVTVNLREAANANQDTVKVMIPNSGSVDSQYVEMKLTGQAKVSNNWFLATSSPLKVHYLNSYPELSVQSDLPDDIYKEDISVSISIKSGSKNQTSKAVIEGVNFRVAIREYPNDAVIQLPANATNLEVLLDVDSFFYGPIADYSINCPFCTTSKIQLQTPISLRKEIKEITNAVDYATVGDRILTLSNSILYLLNSQTLEIVQVSPLPVGNCKNLVYDNNLGLFLFCISNQSPTGQILLQYTVKNDRMNLENVFIVPVDQLISQFDEMFVFYSTPTSYLMILDNDETVDSNKKHSTVKVFSVSGDQFAFEDEWESTDFGTQTVYPINDLDINSGIVFVTLGNYGIGYATFNKGKLMNPSNIELSTIAEIKDVMLPSSFFKQIEMVKYNQEADEIVLFISSTNSLTIVANFIVAEPKLIFKSITESYNRYGKQRLLNWHQVTDKNIFLSYYNETTQLLTIVTYSRIQRKLNEFQEGVTVKLSKNLVKYHQAFVGSNKILVSHLTDVAAEGSLVSYNIRSGYYLLLNYDLPGNFSQISVQASNTYHQISHTQKIQFDSPTPPPPPPPPPGPDDGLKWYVVVIVTAVVLLVVGVAYGLFIYMKNKRSQKNVSLLTEREEGEDSDDAPNKLGKANPLEERLNDTLAES